jgi:hypothetical protein
MSAELIEDIVAYHREVAAVRAELGRLAADLARLAAAVADLKRAWPTDAPHLVILDDAQVH